MLCPVSSLSSSEWWIDTGLIDLMYNFTIIILHSYGSVRTVVGPSSDQPGITGPPETKA